MDLKDIIDTFGVQDLVPMYPRPTSTLPYLIVDSTFIENELIDVPSPSTVSSLLESSSVPPRVKASKKRKISEDLTPQMEVMDLNNFKFDEVILRDVVVLDTLMTYFDKGIFGQPELKRDFYHHFRSNFEWARVRESCLCEGQSNRKLIVDRLIEVNLCTSRFTPCFTLVIFL